MAKFSTMTIWKVAIANMNFLPALKIPFNEKDITEAENESVPIDPDPNLLQVMEKFEISKPMTSFFTPNRLMTPGTCIIYVFWILMILNEWNIPALTQFSGGSKTPT